MLISDWERAEEILKPPTPDLEGLLRAAKEREGGYLKLSEAEKIARQSGAIESREETRTLWKTIQSPRLRGRPRSS